MTTRGHSRKKRKQTGMKWLYITAAGLVCAVILAAILFKIRAGSMDSRHPAGTDASQETGLPETGQVTGQVIPQILRTNRIL